MSLFFGKNKNSDEKKEDWLIPEDSHKHLADVFSKLAEPVHVELFSADKVNVEFTDFARRFLNDLSRITDNIVFEEFAVHSDKGTERKVEAAPTIVIQPDKYSIRMLGAPAGEESRSFIEALLLVGMNTSQLGKSAKEMVKELDEERAIKVFVSPTCPYCPGQAMHAIKCAIERPDLISAQIIEISENPDIADKYGVGSVPHTVFNDELEALGLEPEERFVVQMVTLRSAEDLAEEMREKGKAEGVAVPEPTEDVDLIILGAGPAGLTAAIYGQRSGLDCLVLDGGNIGGQVAVTPVVENYPGFTSIPGAKLVEVLMQHAREYTVIREFERAEELKVGKRIEVMTSKGMYTARALVVATGAKWRKLGVPGEDKFHGHGVSNCASCDGYFYKDSKVVVVGGGNTALTEALHLHNLGADVTIIHRRDEFRGEEHLSKSVEKLGINVLWDSVVTEILGDEELTGVRVKNLRSDESKDVEAKGVFVAIGLNPNSEVVRDIGVALDKYGYISVDKSMRTSIPRIYAAGDITGGFQQIVTATSEGATAAMTAFEDLHKLEA
ncbi:MAG: FAD-dependent oxidoreductase [Desulfovibrio sp.]|uniref:FAD-dependent oxidoreductase n=1 Tax=Desulfovibrio sp. 7SRBS1 TaxID=3378064 RepID=UPI003B406A22